MAAQPWWRTAQTLVQDLFFPPRCQGCGRNGAWFCHACVTGLVRIVPPFCPRCGREIVAATDCFNCRYHTLPAALTGLRSVARFEGSLRHAIHALKYKQVTVLAEPLGALLADYLRAHPLPVTRILPVPLHAERHHERGYNQSTLLATALSRRLGLPLDTETLVRRRHTTPQVGLNERERRINLLHAFHCTRPLPGEHLLLVDDVCTTGATLSECAIALQDAGATTIWGLTLAG